MSEQVATPEERMMSFLEVEDTPPENLDEEPVEEVAAEGEEEVVEDTPEEVVEEAAPQRTFRLKRNGEEIEKPEEEVIALAQQGFDYNEKMHSLKQERAMLEAQATAIKMQESFQSAAMSDIAKIQAIDDQIQQFQAIDWNSLSDSDPVQAQKLFFSFNQLQTQRNQMIQGLNQKQQEFSQQQLQSRQQMLLAGEEMLKKEIPGWGSEVKQSLALVARGYGYSEQEIANLTDPRAVKMLHDAMQWRKLQTDKPTIKNKVANAAPMVKPGSKDPKHATQSNVKKFRDELRRTGNSEYAQKLIERTL